MGKMRAIEHGLIEREIELTVHYCSDNNEIMANAYDQSGGLLAQGHGKNLRRALQSVNAELEGDK